MTMFIDLIIAPLLLRRRREADREPFARINADPRVMEYFPAPLTRLTADGLSLTTNH